MEPQRSRILTEAANRAWNVTGRADDGSSAKNLDRPAVYKALRLLASHGAEALVVAKLDRPTRSVVDVSNTLVVARRQRWYDRRAGSSRR